MTCRYFYKEPLAAAWMAKHFGMRITDGKQEKDLDFRSAVSNGKRLYIHPDSLQLLKPQLYDVVLMNDLEGANSLEFWSEGRNKGKLIRIIEREGDAFHWPQSEESEEA